MPSIIIPDSNVSVDFQIDELTEGSLLGGGVFDVMIATVKAHLREEFDAERIRGTDYANVFANSVTAIMAQASQYALAKSKLGLELQLLEAQLGKLAADTVLVAKQSALVDVQATRENATALQINADTRQTEYVTSFQIPSQIAATEAQTSLVTLQEAQTVQQTLNIVAQRDQLDKQTLDIVASTKLKAVEFEIQTFNKDFRLPKELLILDKEIAIKESQVSLAVKELLVKQAQLDISNKEVLLKQNQIDLGTKELALKDKDLAIKAEQLLITKYELAYKLPADVVLTEAQSSLYNQKTTTEKAQVDPVVIQPNSVIDTNNKLIIEQSKTFLRSAQQTAAKLVIDTWTVRHNSDPDGNRADAANKLIDTTIGKAVEAVMTGANISLV